MICEAFPEEGEQPRALAGHKAPRFVSEQVRGSALAEQPAHREPGHNNSTARCFAYRNEYSASTCLCSVPPRYTALVFATGSSVTCKHRKTLLVSQHEVTFSLFKVESGQLREAVI
ncbi:hypothetical protein CBOM_06441 [Ceraceosorus bombacis]|uniref:Uncharacterized protein n=1 Tax=Ceraceosorus bombacis TaxID=401625 RepID=A0A0P1BK32_9BASI|nr:hypothetical protein CBOM_06441 [Ceraceosorus bombacis]